MNSNAKKTLIGKASFSMDSAVFNLPHLWYTMCVIGLAARPAESDGGKHSEHLARYIGGAHYAGGFYCLH